MNSRPQMLSLFVGFALTVSCAHQSREPKILVSPFPSTVSGVSIPNAHWVGESGEVLRGQRPMSLVHANELKKIGIDHILIFRNETRGESSYAEELTALNGAGYTKEQISIVRFQWKDIPNFETGCRQTIEALQIIKQSQDSQQKIFFHCTVGEDRTGFLAATYRMLTENTSPESLFKSEMCRWGYADGDPSKAEFVSKLIHKNVTPIFAKISFLAHTGALNWNKLQPEVCKLSAQQETEAQAYRLDLEAKTHHLRCSEL